MIKRDLEDAIIKIGETCGYMKLEDCKVADEMILARAKVDKKFIDSLIKHIVQMSFISNDAVAIIEDTKTHIKDLEDNIEELEKENNMLLNEIEKDKLKSDAQVNLLKDMLKEGRG